MDNAQKTELINENVKPIDGALNSVGEPPVAGAAQGSIPPKGAGFAESATPEIINASHLFVVAGQECICWDESIPKSTKKSLPPR